jgi:hypothetical protein
MAPPNSVQFAPFPVCPRALQMANVLTTNEKTGALPLPGTSGYFTLDLHKAGRNHVMNSSCFFYIHLPDSIPEFLMMQVKRKRVPFWDTLFFVSVVSGCYLTGAA